MGTLSKDDVESIKDHQKMGEKALRIRDYPMNSHLLIQPTVVPKYKVS